MSGPGALLLGRLDVLQPNVAKWTAVAVAVLQLVVVGVIVGMVVSADRARVWRYAVGTAVIGIGVVALEVVLSH